MASKSDKRLLKNFSPFWDTAQEFTDDQYYAVECPLKLEKPLGFAIREKEGNPGNAVKSINGDSRLLLLKDKKAERLNLW